MSTPDTAAKPNRLVEHRFVLTCQTRTPLHPGSGAPGWNTDAELRRNGRRDYVIPGASIAGCLRAIVERLAGVERECLLYQRAFRAGEDSAQEPCSCGVCRLFGDVRPSQAAQPSKVSVRDAVVERPKTRVVDGVAISRQRRTAEDGRKYDYRQLLPGSTVRLEVTGENLSDQELVWLAAALRIVATGEVGLGGRTARGHGRLSVDPADCRLLRRDLTQADELLDCVVSDSSSTGWGRVVAEGLHKFPGSSLSLPRRLAVTFHMSPAAGGTFLIADPARAAATGFDSAQRMLNEKMEIPPSSLVGVLRSGAERIVRTLGGRACDPLGQRCRPNDAIVTDDGWCCCTCRLFGNEDWASRLSATVTSLGAAARTMPFDHVAIDRFTGGASDQKKFDALAGQGGMFKVELAVERVQDRAMAQWIIGLLTLVLRDLDEGRLGIGRGSSKGHGRMELAGAPSWTVPAEWETAVQDLQGCVDALWQQVKGGIRQ